MNLRRILFAAGCIAGIAYIRNYVKSHPELLKGMGLGDRLSRKDSSLSHSQDQVDLSSDQSFPASDAPSWSPSVTDTRH